VVLRLRHPLQEKSVQSAAKSNRYVNAAGLIKITLYGKLPKN
jgi:hypothetical protein